MSSETESYLQSEVERLQNGVVSNGTLEAKKIEDGKDINDKSGDFNGSVQKFSVPSAAVKSKNISNIIIYFSNAVFITNFILLNFSFPIDNWLVISIEI